MTWCEDIEQALIELGGRAHLSEIYEMVKQIREKRGLPLGQYKAWIRYFLQQNSRGKGKDIFNPVKIGSGIWELKVTNR
jgi:hypothetical protein